VHQLDRELAPERCACGVQIYTEHSVEAYLVRRAAAELSQVRRERMLALRGGR
jgi:hypothetical protein